MSTNDERMIILEKIESGEISVEDGGFLLDALDGRRPLQAEAGYGLPPTDGMIADPVPLAGEVLAGAVQPTAETHPQNEDFNRWKVWSWVAFGLAVLLTTLGAVWITQGWMVHPWGWGFWLAWIPFWLGVVGMIATFKARWVHVRIRQTQGEKPERIVISLPFSTRLVRIGFPFISRWLPEQLKGENLAQLLVELENSLSSDEPIHIQVDEPDGEQVEVYIG